MSHINQDDIPPMPYICPYCKSSFMKFDDDKEDVSFNGLEQAFLIAVEGKIIENSYIYNNVTDTYEFDEEEEAFQKTIRLICSVCKGELPEEFNVCI